MCNTGHHIVLQNGRAFKARSGCSRFGSHFTRISEISGTIRKRIGETRNNFLWGWVVWQLGDDELYVCLLINIGSDAPGFLDYMIWPWIERVPAIKLFAGTDCFDFEAAKKANPRLVINAEISHTSTPLNVCRRFKKMNCKLHVFKNTGSMADGNESR